MHFIVIGAMLVYSPGSYKIKNKKIAAAYLNKSFLSKTLIIISQIKYQST